MLIPFIDAMTFPHVLYRGFTQLSYALDFIQSGRFRLGRLDVYQDIEDISRSDNSEGMGHFVSPDGASMHFELGNPTYLFCCSVGDVDIAFLRRRMGPFIVRITQPNQLTLLIVLKDIIYGHILMKLSNYLCVEIKKQFHVGIRQ